MRLFRRGEAASTLDLLVAGLGNPGARHERDRHNVGWMVVDELARRRDASFKSKFNGGSARRGSDDHRLALLKPETYMNESGRSISAAARFFKVAPEDVLVVHDDVDLEFGRLQAREGGGLGGPQRPALDRAGSRDPGLPAAARSVSAAPDAAIRATSRTSCSRRSRRTRIATDSSRGPPMRSRCSSLDGLEEAQRRFN